MHMLLDFLKRDKSRKPVCSYLKHCFLPGSTSSMQGHVWSCLTKNATMKGFSFARVISTPLFAIIIDLLSIHVMGMLMHVNTYDNYRFHSFIKALRLRFFARNHINRKSFYSAYTVNIITTTTETKYLQLPS